MARRTAAASPLPAALLKNAAAAASAAHVKRLATEGREAIAEVKACRASIGGDYFAMGEAVKALKKGVAHALGRADFAEVWAKDLDISVTKAAQLVTLAGASAQQPTRGFTASAVERTLFAQVTKRWQRKDLASAVSVELKANRKAHGAEVAVRMPLALWATLAPPPR